MKIDKINWSSMQIEFSSETELKLKVRDIQRKVGKSERVNKVEKKNSLHHMLLSIRTFGILRINVHCIVGKNG
jgi:hypothetical protein